MLLIDYLGRTKSLNSQTSVDTPDAWRPISMLQSLLDTVPGQLAHIPELAPLDEAKAAQMVCEQEGH